MRISIFGLGYVGAVTGACLAKLGHTIIGVDPDVQKLGFIRDGKSPIMEDGLDELITAAVQDGRLRATDDVEEAISGTELSLVCVGTPSLPNGGLRTEFVERVAGQIGPAVRAKDKFHSIVIRSTVLPGTTEGKVVPILEDTIQGKAGQAFGISMHPEFLREGSSVKDFFDPPFTVVGTDDQEEFQRVTSIYTRVPGTAVASSDLEVQGERIRCAVSTAEVVKYACNLFHAVKITFANEMGMFCRSSGVNAREAMEILCRDHKLNISEKYLTPGFAFGGSCLPKDLRACLERGRKQDVAMPMFEAVLPSNRHQIEQVADRIKGLGSRRISMMGISFKEATDDLRESPLVRLAELLIGQGYDLRIYDPNVRYAAIYGSNKAFIDRELPHLKSVLVGAEQAIAHADVVVLGHKHSMYQDFLGQIRPDQKVVDLIGISDRTGSAVPSMEPRSTTPVEGLYW